MNSNNLELSLIENEIEKIQSKYHLPHQQQAQHLPLQSQHNQQQQTQQQTVKFNHNNRNADLGLQNQLSTKSPSVISFGNANSNPFQELTLNRQGQIPASKQDQKGNSSMAKINPKELSNDELEYIIKTGQLPQRLIETNNSNVLTQDKRSKQGSIDKENQMQAINTRNNMYTNYNEEQAKISLKNYNSPRMMQPDKIQISEEVTSNINPLHLAQTSLIQLDSSSYRPFQEQSILQQSSMQPFNQTSQNPFSFSTQFQQQQNQFQNNQIANNNTYQNQQTMQNSQLSISQLQPTNSQAATSALKALQERVKGLEQQNQLLQDKLLIQHQQYQETISILQQKLKDESQSHSKEVSSLQQEILASQHNLESEKLKHNQEHQKWIAIHRDQQETITQLQDKYIEIERAISELKTREQKLRDRYEQELESEKQRVEEAKVRYDEMKRKLKAKIEEEKKEWEEAEKKRMQREVERYQRECQMLKEEISIMGQHSVKKNKKKDKQQQQQLKESKIAGSQSSATPKNHSHSLRSSRRCKSPVTNDSKLNTQTLLINQTLEKSQQQQQKLQSTDEKLKHSKSSAQKQQSHSVSKKRTPSESRHYDSSNKHQNGDRKSSHGGKKSSSLTKQSSSGQKQKSKRQHPALIKSSKPSQSSANLISINTKEQVVDYQHPAQKHNQREELILVEGESSKPQQFINQFKRTSVESAASTIQFGLSSSSSVYSNTDHLNMLQFSQHQANNASKQNQMMIVDSQQSPANSNLTLLPDPNQVDNEIFYLEREIYDFNQQYKSLLSQQSSVDSHNFSTNGLNQKLRQIAQMLEEKSERLFQLKKQQQQIIMRDSYKSTGSNSASSYSYQVKQNY